MTERHCIVEAHRKDVRLIGRIKELLAASQILPQHTTAAVVKPTPSDNIFEKVYANVPVKPCENRLSTFIWNEL